MAEGVIHVYLEANSMDLWPLTPLRGATSSVGAAFETVQIILETKLIFKEHHFARFELLE